MVTRQEDPTKNGYEWTTEPDQSGGINIRDASGGMVAWVKYPPDADDIIQAFADAAASDDWQRLAERLAWHLSDCLFFMKKKGWGGPSSYGDTGEQALADFRTRIPDQFKLPRDYEGRTNPEQPA